MSFVKFLSGACVDISGFRHLNANRRITPPFEYSVQRRNWMTRLRKKVSAVLFRVLTPQPLERRGSHYLNRTGEPPECPLWREQAEWQLWVGRRLLARANISRD